MKRPELTYATDNNWGVVPIGASKVPMRWIVLWVGIAGWVGVTFIGTGGPSGITALAFNLTVLIGVVLVSTLTRSVPLRTIALMFFSGAVMMGLTLVIEKPFYMTFLQGVRGIVLPPLEEALKLVPLAIFAYRARRFSLWTLGASDVMVMGAASGAGFAVVNDAFRHIQTQWVHSVPWLPTADFLQNSYLASGHLVWSSIAGASLGAALLYWHDRKVAYAVALVGCGLVVIDHLGASNFHSPLGWLFSMFTLKGQLTPYIFLASIGGVIFLDSWIGVRWFPKASEFKLPKKGDSASGLGGLWEFVLDRRRLAFANFRRMHDKGNSYASMAVAVLSQSLINQHSPSKMAKLFETMSTSAGMFEEAGIEALPGGEPLDLPEQYQVMARISIGGMGAIYKSRHRKTNAMVAIKILHAHVADIGNNRQRFDLEAKAAAALKHPNLVIVHDYGITPKKIPYLVMELIEGTTLQHEFGKGSGLPPGRFFHIFDQVCAALAHAHSKGVIHRDIKPSNILLTRSAEIADYVKVVDFGIAKVIDPRGVGGSELTQTGDILGSPMYMSPEQCMGEPMDVRTDIYSLGCVMYQAITGKPPILAENVVKIIFKHVNVVPDRISVARPDINLPPSMEQIIFKALEKKPENRFASMEELRNALASVRKTMAV